MEKSFGGGLSRVEVPDLLTFHVDHAEDLSARHFQRRAVPRRDLDDPDDPSGRWVSPRHACRH